jgi:hypothetical protein
MNSTERVAPNGRYSGVSRLEGPRASGGVSAVDRALRKNADAVGKGYDLDARAIAKVLVRHYGDEAEAILKRTMAFLDEARRAKR